MTDGHECTRREFLSLTAAASALAAGSAMGLAPARADAAAAAPAPAPAAKSRVVVLRHDSLAESAQGPAPEKIRELLDEAARALAGDAKAADAWARWFKPADRVAVKVNCLGYSTRPSVAAAAALAIGAAGVPPEKITIWDRTNRELKAGGYELRDSGKAVRCYGTDALGSRGSGGYTADVVTSGAIGSLFSRIVSDEATALVSACALKDHPMAGVTCALKNFYGAIHNPNKYHDNNCDPFIADVCSHQLISGKLRLAVCDALRPQYNGGPAARPQWQWPYGAIILATDLVALDRVAWEIIARRRAAAKMPALEAERRPVRYLATAAKRGLGKADLADIEVTSIGKPWQEVG